MFQHQMRLECLHHWQDCAYTRFKLSTIDEASNLTQTLARDLDQKECRFDTEALRKVLIGR